MKPHLDMNKIARGLRAERKGRISAGGGYLGAMQLLAEIEARPPPTGDQDIDVTVRRGLASERTSTRSTTSC